MNVQKCAKMSSERGVQISRRSNGSDRSFTGLGLGVCGKRKNFGRGRRENEFGRKRDNIETYCKCENSPNMSLFITRIL